MAQTSTISCPNCETSVLRVKLNVSPFLTICVDPTPNPAGHVVETGDGTARVLKLDRSDLVGGEIVYKAHHLSCNS